MCKQRVVISRMKFSLRIFAIAFLTILTQIGGAAYVLSFSINRYIGPSFIPRKWLRIFIYTTFPIVYGLFTFIVVPTISPYFGRVQVVDSGGIRPVSFIPALLNRNYVRPEVNSILLEAEKLLAGTNINIIYLDANFPFINGFPLLPHLSHNDGRKIDVSLVYEHNGSISNRKKSVTGYGVYEEPAPTESNQPRVCLEKGYFQYDYPKYFTLGAINSELVFSESGTSKLIASILDHEGVSKLFIEPHLKERLNLVDSRIRFHGCRAVRHDDHIHFQL